MHQNHPLSTGGCPCNNLSLRLVQNIGQVSWAKVTAVFCGNDNLALGALFECQRRRILVPDNMSIIGFNDLEFSACSYPSLSSIATPRYEMAQLSAEIILDIIRGSGNRPKEHQVDLGFRLISRESSGKLSKLD